jgi:hypothetical protein
MFVSAFFVYPTFLGITQSYTILARLLLGLRLLPNNEKQPYVGRFRSHD